MKAAEVRALLQRAVDEKGADYIYNGDGWNCKYFDMSKDGKLVPDCIIGHLLSYLGITLKDMVGEGVNTTKIRLLVERGTVLSDISHPVVLALSAAQQSQDQGETWGAALQAFDREIAEWQAVHPNQDI